MSEYMKVPADTFETIQMDAGIICTSFTPSTGAFSGIVAAIGSDGFAFKSNPTFEDFGEDIGNVPPNTWQMKRVKYYDPTVTGNYKNVTAALLKALEAGSSFAASGTPAVEDQTHIVPSHVLKEGNFTDLYFIGNYSNHNTGVGSSGAYAGYMVVHLKKALNVTGFSWQTVKDGKGTFAFEYHGHYDLNNMDDPPFEYYIRKGSAGSLASLTVTSEAGTSSGKSKITVSGYSLGSGESYVYQTAASAAPEVAYGDDVSAWTDLTSGSEITPASGHTKITVAVKDTYGKAVGSGAATLVIAE